MYNLVMKDMKLGLHPMLFALPVMTGALMLIPGWIYFLVLLYFCWISIPNMFSAFRAQNDLMMTATMPVTKEDIVKARVFVIVFVELLHVVFAAIFGVINVYLYPDFDYHFFAPSMGFWGLGFVMYGLFNLALIPIYYKTAYKFGGATFASISAAMLFALIAQWAGIENAHLSDLFAGDGLDRTWIHASILVAGIAIFALCTFMAYRMAVKRFLKVEI